MELTATNLSIDILTSFIFLIATWRGVVAMYFNHLNFRDKAYIFLFTVSSGLYVFQTIMQTQTGYSASTTVWNVINGIHAFLALSIITLLSKKQNNEKVTRKN